MNNVLFPLYQTLEQRKRPEDVAELVLEVIGPQLNFFERQTLQKASAGSLANNFWGYTSMAQQFAKVVGAETQVKTAVELFELTSKHTDDFSIAENIEQFVRTVSPLINKQFGENDFSKRLNRIQRKEKGLDLSKRSYNKKWRMLKRLEGKILKVVRESRKLEFQKISKHGLAHHISFDDFSSDVNTACFIAYYNARCNRRSVFTNTSQDRAFDEICDMLFERCKKNTVTTNWWAILGDTVFARSKNNTVTTNWWAIAGIYVTTDVLQNISEEQKGVLLGRWTAVLHDIALMLEQVYAYSDINRNTMIVRRGNDSTTWNNTAGAWNKARDAWMNLIYALGMDEVLNELCFGKVMRLMAADVVAWHKNTGGKLDPNTFVWCGIPLPWQVFSGSVKCNRQMIEDACKSAGINAERSGWITPRKHGVVAFKPTPELLHGVQVSNPYLAVVLKRSKYYSGKPVKPIFPNLN